MNFDKLEKFQDWLCNEWRIPGNACICHVNGKEVYRHFAGYSDIESKTEMNGSELFNMYSISKTVTTLAALQLLEKGLFELNEGLDRYLPEFHGVKVRVKKDDGTEEIRKAENWIRIRDLFQMTSGYDYTVDNEYIRARQSAPGVITTREMAKALGETPLCFEPGEKWLYGMSHDILAALVEVISGERFSTYVQKNIFDPAGMKNSYFHLSDEEIEKRMASQYSFDDNSGKAIKVSKKNGFVFGDEYDSGGAGIISCAEDMARYADIIACGGVTRDGKRLISRAAIDLWRRNTLSEKQRVDYNWSHLEGYGYGLGVRTHVDPAKSGSLTPVGEFGWTGAAGGYILIDPDNGVSMFYAHHMLNNQEWFTIPRLRNLLYACLEY